MTTSERLVYLLGLNSDLVGMLGGTKFYRGVAPQGTAFDYVVFAVTTGRSIITQDDSDNRLKMRLYTFKAYSIGDSVHSGPARANSLIMLVRASFRNISERPGIQSIVPGIGPLDLGWSETERAYGLAQEFEVWSDLD
jgi:hypothetical protein